MSVHDDPSRDRENGRQGSGNNKLATAALFLVAATVLIVLRTTTEVPYVPRILLSLGAGLVAALVVYLTTSRRSR